MVPGELPLQDRVLVRDLALHHVVQAGERVVVERLPELAGGLVLLRPGRRPQRRHQLQAGDRGRTARRHHPLRVGAQEPGEVGRVHGRQLRIVLVVPLLDGQGAPGRDAQLHTPAPRALRVTVDAGPRAEAPLGELLPGPGDLLEHLVAGREPAGPTLLRRQLGRQAVPLQRCRGQDEDGVGVLAVAVQAGLPEARFLHGPVDQGGQRLGGHVQDQAADAVRHHLAVVIDVDHGQRTVLEPPVHGRRRGQPLRSLLRTRAP